MNETVMEKEVTNEMLGKELAELVNRFCETYAERLLIGICKALDKELSDDLKQVTVGEVLNEILEK